MDELPPKPTAIATAARLLGMIRAGRQDPLGYHWPSGLVATINEADDPAVFIALAEALIREPEIIRAAAATALGNAGNPEALYTLEPLLQDESDFVRGRTLYALEELGPCDDLEALLISLATGDPVKELRKSAIRSLGQLRSSRSDAALRDALNDPDPEIRAVVRATCERFKRPV